MLEILDSWKIVKYTQLIHKSNKTVLPRYCEFTRFISKGSLSFQRNRKKKTDRNIRLSNS